MVVGVGVVAGVGVGVGVGVDVGVGVGVDVCVGGGYASVGRYVGMDGCASDFGLMCTCVHTM